MAQCTNCGQFAAPGPQLATTTCQPCAAAAAAGNPVPKTAVITDHVDTSYAVPFEVPAGSFVSGGMRWTHSEAIHHDSMVITELRATVAGHSDDVARFLPVAVVQLVTGDRVVFERPLAFLTASEHGLDAEVAERLSRLERMMNVLVEQDSAAGEALRRLGGAKIDFDSPTRLKRPELVHQHDRFVVCMTFDSAVEIARPVSVRVSVMGVSKRLVA